MTAKTFNFIPPPVRNRKSISSDEYTPASFSTERIMVHVQKLRSIACDIIRVVREWRVVLDTNVLVASFRSDRGASRKILLNVLSRKIPVLVSVPLMIEYEAVLT